MNRASTESVIGASQAASASQIGGLGDVSDEDLLGRFMAGRDDRAFAELVSRHGPMVMAVCRRTLGIPQDAEDAFQAAFLVLARKAKSLRNARSLPAWLYQTAYR